MALELQNAVIAAVRAALPEHDIIEEPATPPWLNRPGRADCGAAWPLVSDLYRELTGLELPEQMPPRERRHLEDRKSTRLNSSHVAISYAVFCLKKKQNIWISLA